MKTRSPEHCLELEKWQGPPHTNKDIHYKIVFIQSCKQRPFFYLVCSSVKNIGP